MIVAEDIFVMLLTQEEFKTFTPKKFVMQRKARKCLRVCPLGAEKRSMRWFARQSPAAEQLIMNHKTTALCMDMGYKTWTATFGK
jgi:predicted lactoylglutathione lyase